MSPPSENAAATVVVVHGLWMTGSMLAVQRRRLAQHGYRTLSFSYPSVRASWMKSRTVSPRWCARCEAAPRASDRSQPRRHRRPCICWDASQASTSVARSCSAVRAPVPPQRRSSARSRTGARIDRQSHYQWRPDVGVAAAERFEIGSIAGTLRLGMGRLLVPIPSPNDGVVCLHETQLPGFRDHVAWG